MVLLLSEQPIASAYSRISRSRGVISLGSGGVLVGLAFTFERALRAGNAFAATPALALCLVGAFLPGISGSLVFELLPVTRVCGPAWIDFSPTNRPSPVSRPIRPLLRTIASSNRASCAIRPRSLRTLPPLRESRTILPASSSCKRSTSPTTTHAGRCPVMLGGKPERARPE